ncbi:MAG: Unknown protein [uncultured Sulfurovum sp.]|uniref:UDP-2,4-diacetamido-2,4, 6-trideoxy-beta-L-altropyranose hydrolase n=1 Tax=uncultured Sulfurovum sp. TaxID=269237 RepID=A0A6S6U1B9_9BACT|nr:MAG: Unknown protein [uncultured Sulfurovum sp.]
MKKILFRADSSSTIGTGHIMRDLVLATQYPNSEIIFATQDLEGNLNSKIVENGYEVKNLLSNDINELINMVNELQVEMVIIDHYGIDYAFEKALKEQTNVEIMVLDDTYEQHYCDILLNHNIYADENKYKDLVPTNCELRCGQNFTLLRDEFIKAKESTKKPISTKRGRVFIAMGGADTANLNPKIIQLLEGFDNIIVEIVTSTANKHIEELKNLVSNKGWINLHINSLEIGALMAKSDFSIVTPSVTLNEVWYMKLPFIAIKTADNQKYMCKYLEERKLIILDDFNPYILTKHVLNYMKSFSMLAVAYEKINRLLSKYDKNRVYFQKSKKNKKKLWISFSSRNTDKFAFYKNLCAMEENILFINDNTASYYNSSINGLCNNVDELIEIQRKVIDTYAWEKVICIGSSMGGYASLLFGSILKVDQVIAFSPQIDLEKPFSINPQKKITLIYKDLSSLINNNYETKYTILSSTHLEDIYNVLKIKKKNNIDLFLLNYCSFCQGHNILKEMSTNGISLQKLFLDLSNENYLFLETNNFNALFSNLEVIDNYHKFFEDYNQNKFDVSQCTIESKNFFYACAFQYSNWTQMVNVCIDFLIKDKNYSKGVLLLQSTLSFVPQAYFLYKKLLFLYFVLNKKVLAEALIENISAINFEEHINFLSLSVDLFKVNNIEGSLYCLDYFMNIEDSNKDNYLALYHKGLLFIGINKLESILAFQACIASMEHYKKLEDWRYERSLHHIENLKYQIFKGSK